jgi:hypothetical protein
MLRSKIGSQRTESFEQGRTVENLEDSQAGGETSRRPGEIDVQNALPVRAIITQKSKSKETTRPARASAFISLIFLPSSFLLSMVPSAGNAASFSYSVLAATGKTVTVWTRLKIFADHFYPRSGISFSDLDQVVATAAGATVLAFSIYSAAIERYEMQSKRRQRVNEDGNELDQLDPGRTNSGLRNGNYPTTDDEHTDMPE